MHPPLTHSFGRGPGHSHPGSGRPGGRSGGRNGGRSRPGSVLAVVRTAGHPGRHPDTACGHHPGMATSLETTGYAETIGYVESQFDGIRMGANDMTLVEWYAP